MSFLKQEAQPLCKTFASLSHHATLVLGVSAGDDSGSCSCSCVRVHVLSARSVSHSHLQEPPFSFP